MNHTHDNDHHDDAPSTPLDDSLRWQLRALRQDSEPGRDLWPGIAARLTPQAAPRRRGMRLAPLAMAAGVLLVVGSIGWLARTPAPTAQAGPTLVQREADGLTRQYEAALQEMQMPMPASLRPTAEVLERDAALIRSALSQDPDSVQLLEQLRRTYAHRLALAQRVAYT